MVPTFWQPEHLHVMLNHLPVTLILLLAPLLLAGLISRNPAVLAVAFSLGLLADLATPLVMQTGERAYHRFNGAQIQPPLDERGDIAMELHEDAAEKAAPFLYVTGLGCIAGLIFLRWRPDWVRGCAWLVLLISLAAAGFTLRAAVLGGHIRHPEFRPAVDETPEHIRNE
ncbi:MAG: hypothetical protein EBT68_05135 [Verrucomicrobia bacterium]|nr:hypothetical protein [Verrucomicrobiota bacterium]NBR64292.1 hypothetical protein [Verrucomicrobiota bacterium]